MTARDYDEQPSHESRGPSYLADPETVSEAETVITEILLADVTVTENGDAQPEE